MILNSILDSQAGGPPQEIRWEVLKWQDFSAVFLRIVDSRTQVCGMSRRLVNLRAGKRRSDLRQPSREYPKYPVRRECTGTARGRR